MLWTEDKHLIMEEVSRKWRIDMAVADLISTHLQFSGRYPTQHCKTQTISSFLPTLSPSSRPMGHSLCLGQCRLRCLHHHRCHDSAKSHFLWHFHFWDFAVSVDIGCNCLRSHPFKRSHFLSTLHGVKNLIWYLLFVISLQSTPSILANALMLQTDIIQLDQVPICIDWWLGIHWVNSIYYWILFNARHGELYSATLSRFRFRNRLRV